jgi:hypothetical protein
MFSKDLNWFVDFFFKQIFGLKTTLFWDCYSAFHYFRGFFLLLFSKFVFMNPTSLWQGFFIWMLLFVTFENFF